jgi:hypothetical protein
VIGKRFTPRLRNLKGRKFHGFEKAAACPKTHRRRLIEAHVRFTGATRPWFRFAYMKSKIVSAAERRMATTSETATNDALDY